MQFVIGLALAILIIFAPQWWAQYTFRKYSKPLDRIKGTGAELAHHLVNRFEMKVNVEETQPDQDHYDPNDKCVRLSPNNYHGKSLTAIAVAAHEVGHAIQHHRKEGLLEWRTRLARLANAAQKFGISIMMIMPVVTGLTRAPSIGGGMFLLGISTMFLATLVHLVTLPVEVDASFNKALPILADGYIDKEDIPAVKKILRAAAFTYLAGSLASLLNLWRWIAILRR